jgi:uncharacterized protein (TIGR00730 family)
MVKGKSICVFCGSRVGKQKEYITGIKALATALYNNRCNVVYGGAAVGLMGALADECLKLGLNVTGIIPEKFDTREIAHDKLTKLVKVKTMHERKFKMYEVSDAFLIIPGGLGTMDEFFEILTWKQIGLHDKPIAIWNFNSYYDALIKFLDFTQDQGFVSGLDTLIHVSPDLKEIFDYI